MDLKLNVDVHVAAADDGLMLVVGGLVRPLKGTELEAILRGKPLKHKRREAAPFAKGETAKRPGLAKSKPSKPASVHPGPAASRAARRAKGLCSWCDKKPVEGKLLCKAHLAGARENAQRSRSKKRAA